MVKNGFMLKYGQFMKCRHKLINTEPVDVQIDSTVLDYLDKDVYGFNSENEYVSYNRSDIVNRILYSVLAMDDDIRKDVALGFLEKACYALRDYDVEGKRHLMDDVYAYINLYSSFGGYKYFGDSFWDMFDGYWLPHVEILKNGFVVCGRNVNYSYSLNDKSDEIDCFFYNPEEDVLTFFDSKSVTDEALMKLSGGKVSLDDVSGHLEFISDNAFGTDNFKSIGFGLPYIYFKDESVEV